jgi:flagellum-specific peptidoglycan hydrolase FlgJ
VSKTQSSVSKLWFRVYKTHEASFEDFSSLISRKYPAAFACAKDPAAYAKAIAASPYISEANGDDRPAYARALSANAVTIAAIAQRLNISLA